MPSLKVDCPGCGREKSARARLCSACRRTAIETGVKATEAGLLRVVETATRGPTPAAITPGQRRAINAKAQAIATLRGHGGKRSVKDEFYARTAEHFGRRITSSEHMNEVEAHWCLDRLEEAIEQAEESRQAD